MFCPVCKKKKDLKLSAAGRLTHGAQTCYKEAEIVDQGPFPNASHLGWK